MTIFGFELEFDHHVVRERIDSCCAQRGKGYICIVDGPSLARSHQNPDFMQVLHRSYLNTCDGGSIAIMSQRLYGRDLHAFTGPEIFAEYIEQPRYRQLLLGNREERFVSIKQKMQQEGHTTDHLSYMPLPFADVDQFDYADIARRIEQLDVDIIWVSLGAPKQEFFMHRLLPHLSHGLLFGIGAAFDFYTGDLKDYSFHLGEFRFNWIYRLFVEPRKQFKRIWTVLTCYPTIYLKEKKKTRR